MADLVPGWLSFAENRVKGQAPIRRLSYRKKNGDFTTPGAFQPDQLSADLAQRTDPEIEVELEVVGGKPLRIRPKGGAWIDPDRPAPSSSLSRQTPRAGGGGNGRVAEDSDHHFHNPYSFIPAPARDVRPGQPLGDGPAPSQDRFHPDHHYGRIVVEMTAVTPLLLPNAADAKELPGGHKIFPLRTRPDGTPDIPPTAVKGMLRAAFEAVTNSRFGVFTGHDSRLGWRMESRDALGMVPARIHAGRVELLLGTNPDSILRSAAPPQDACAAWLPRYTAGMAHDRDRRALTYPDGSLPAHGDRVRCLIHRFRHHRWRNNRHEKSFCYWQVVAVARAGGADALEPPPARRDHGPRDGSNWHEPLNDPPALVEGWVCITNQNFSKKHDERVFFTTSRKPPSVALDPAWCAAWDELIADYRAIHEKDLEKRRGKVAPESPEARAAYAAFRGRNPGETAWSPHLYDDRRKALSDGTLCHARIDPDTGRITGLFPVMISRSLHERAPAKLLHHTLHPARSREQQSPADRVFGWVSGAGAGASRGNLRIGPVEPVAGTVAVKSFDPPLPLAILGQPKPHYARFYVADGSDGRSQPSGTPKEETGYTDGKGLRGRKVYPHHKDLPDGYWGVTNESRLDHAGRFREFLRATPEAAQENRQDDQNRSITAWVGEGSRFRFTIDVTHLSDVELGALLWLLHLPDGMVHRFGGGKPLGFGSVRLRMVDTDIIDGAALADRYRSLSVDPPSAFDPTPFIRRFRQAAVAADGGGRPFERVPWIAAFLTAARGLGGARAPVHYPRTVMPDDGQGPPRPRNRGENFRWFVENDRAGGRTVLPDLGTNPDTAPAPLPIWRSKNSR